MDKYEVSSVAVNKAIVTIGEDVKSFARKLGVSYQTVVNWKTGRSLVSPFNCQKIEQVTNGQVTRQDLLPDYPWEDFK